MKLVHDFIASRSPSKHDQRPPEITGHMVLSSLRIALLPLIPEAPDREPIIPLQTYFPFDNVELVLSHLDVLSLGKFRLLNKECSQEADRFMWKSMVFRDRKYDAASEAYIDFVAFCDFARRRATFISSLRIRMEKGLPNIWNSTSRTEMNAPSNIRRIAQEKILGILTSMPNLLRLDITIDDEIMLAVLFRADFPFRLQALEMQSVCLNVGATPFIKSQDQIQKLVYHPLQLWPPIPPIPSASLPNLTHASGRLLDVRQLVAGRPISVICVDTAITHWGIPAFHAALTGSTTNIINLKFHLHHPVTPEYALLLGACLHPVPHLLHLELFIHSNLASDMKSRTVQEKAKFSLDFVRKLDQQVPDLETLVLTGSLPDTFSTLFTVLLTRHGRERRCRMLQHVDFAGCELGGVIVRRSESEPWKLVRGKIRTPRGAALVAGMTLVGDGWEHPAR